MSCTTMTAEPAACGVTVSVLPEMVALPIDVFDCVRMLYGGRPPLMVAVCAGRPLSTNVSVVGEMTSCVGLMVTASVAELVEASVMVTVQVPTPTGVTVSVEPDTATVAMAVFELLAAYGAIPLLMVAVPVEPKYTVSAVGETATGGLTVTATVAVSLSASVTVSVHVPVLSGVTVTVEPETVAVAIAVLDELTVYGVRP